MLNKHNDNIRYFFNFFHHLQLYIQEIITNYFDFFSSVTNLMQLLSKWIMPNKPLEYNPINIQIFIWRNL
jgi:hypothetical protein